MIESVRRAIEPNLLMLPGVTGVAVDDKIVVYVESEEYTQAVPSSIAGVEVETKVTGKITALGFQTTDQTVETVELKRRGKVRPVVGGVSVAGEELYASGTLGIITQNGLILSNAHVLAMTRSAEFVEENVAIIQPGYADGGSLDDRIGELIAYCPIIFNDPGAENYVDAAIGVIDEGIEYLAGEVLDADEESTYKVDLTPVEVEKGDIVRKSGRTTGVTYGVVENPSVTIRVNYLDKWAVMKDVIAVRSEKHFARSGDSGSVVDKDGKIVGLAFAASGNLGFVCKAKYFLPTLIPPARNIVGLLVSFGILGLALLPAVTRKRL